MNKCICPECPMHNLKIQQVFKQNMQEALKQLKQQEKYEKFIKAYQLNKQNNIKPLDEEFKLET